MVKRTGWALTPGNPLRNQASASPLDALIAMAGCFVLIIGFMWYSVDFVHWFVLPVGLCGVLIGIDAVAWFRGKSDTFDPVGVLALLGVHFFFLAPLLHVSSDYWMVGVASPSDWRNWLGWMALLNCAGLIAYRLGLRMASWRAPMVLSERRIVWKHFVPVILVGLMVTAGVQFLVYRQFGGLVGYMQSFAAQDGSFAGMGFTFMISESFPILALMGYLIWAKHKGRTLGWGQVLVLLSVFLVARMLFGGFRGSRSNTIWALVWAAGMIHFWARRFSRAVIYVGMAFLVLFMYVYGFYKGAGLDAVRMFQGVEAREELVQETGRSLEVVLLGDLGRSDVQAFLLYRLTKPDSDYRYAWGKTYGGAASLLIPRSIWPERPPTKVRAGTDAQYGVSPYYDGMWQSSRIYGLAGEAMLNFGPWSVPLMFLLLGFLVGSLRRLMLALQPNDVRWLLVPFLVCLCFIGLSSDSDNIIFVLVKNGAVPTLVITVSSRQYVAE